MYVMIFGISGTKQTVHNREVSKRNYYLNPVFSLNFSSAGERPFLTGVRGALSWWGGGGGGFHVHDGFYF